MIPDNVKSIPENIRSNQELIQEALNLGCTKAKVILTQTVSMAHWVKLHCQFGCSHYGTLLTCPPCTPNADEMGEILAEYDKALLINATPGANVQEIVVSLENSFRQKGYLKAFALCAQPCNLCDPCTVTTNCKYPEKARPTLQSCGIDVNGTVNNNGWTDLGRQEPCSESHSIGMVLLS